MYFNMYCNEILVYYFTSFFGPNDYTLETTDLLQSITNCMHTVCMILYSFHIPKSTVTIQLWGSWIVTVDPFQGKNRQQHREILRYNSGRKKTKKILSQLLYKKGNRSTKE